MKFLGEGSSAGATNVAQSSSSKGGAPRADASAGTPTAAGALAPVPAVETAPALAAAVPPAATAAAPAPPSTSPSPLPQAAGVGGNGDAGDAGRLPSKHKQAPWRRDEGRGKRQRKGDAKRERARNSMAHAAKSCQYYHDEHGLRRVRPYIYEFKTHAKERWLGRTIIDVFTKEFGGEPRSHHERVMRLGLLTVNGKKIDPDYKIGNGDLICNRMHRHEPPVSGGDIPIVCESADVLVVDKPCTVPIHPCGSYRFNTLFFILQQQRPGLTLRVCHRLDRLTSGLTIIAKTAERAGVIQKQIGLGKTRKTYLARVFGDFGQRLPADRRQAGSPASPEAAAAAAAAAMSSVRADGRPSSLEPGGSGPPSPQKNDEQPTPVTSVPAAAAAAGDENNETSPVSPRSKGDDGVVGEDGAGELWWRYECLGEGVVRSKGRGLQSVVAGSPARPVGEIEGGAVDKTGDSLVSGSLSSGSGGGGVGEDEGAPEKGVVVRVNCPISVLDYKHGVYECSPSGKEAQTTIRKVDYDPDSDTSMVECTPVHGRTHQIRLHLQWTGHPIANDPCYGGELHFGNPEAKRRAKDNPDSHGWKGVPKQGVARASKGREGNGVDQPRIASENGSGGGGIGADAVSANSGGYEKDSVEDKGGGRDAEQQPVLKRHPAVGTPGESARASPTSSVDNACASSGEEARISASAAAAAAAAAVPGDDAGEIEGEGRRDGEDDEAFMIRTCSMCQSGERFKDTQLHCDGIWLHALRYQGPDWAFETKIPSWATFQIATAASQAAVS